MANRDAELVFLQIQEQLELKEEPAFDSEETLRSCIELLKMVHEKSLKDKITSSEESTYVLSSLGVFLANLYPRKKKRKKMELSSVERERRRKHMLKYWEAKRAEAKNKKTPGGHKELGSSGYTTDKSGNLFDADGNKVADGGKPATTKKKR